MEIEARLREGIASVISTAYKQDISSAAVKLEPTNQDFKGDYTFVCFPYSRFSGKNPEMTAQEIGEKLLDTVDFIDSFNVVKGFLNLSIKSSVWIKAFASHEPVVQNQQGDKVMVEYSSPNTNKPLHLGHVRNNLLGYSVSRILENAGNEVVKTNLVNDRGIHICKSMLAWQKFGAGETPESSGMKGDHLVGKYYVEFDKHYREQVKSLIEGGMEKDAAEKEALLMKEAQEMLRKWENGDQATIDLWKTMNGWVYAGFEITYRNLGVSFDKYYYESNTYVLGKNIIEEGLQKGVFYRKPDNSVWINLTEEGLDEKLVLRSDGTSVYITQDIGTAQLKFDEYHCNRFIYVVGNEQDYHFKVLFLILKKLGRTWAEGLYHLSYGMVDLPSGKMKSREGTVVDADDLMQEMIAAAKEKTEELGKTDGLKDEEKQQLYTTLGMGALKFFLLKVDPQKRMLFNPAESIDLQGDTGPFVQYTYARIQSMLRAADPVDLTHNLQPETVADSEKELMKSLMLYESEVIKAANTYSPSVIVAYALQVAKAFNRVYNDVSFLKEPDENKRRFRLRLASVTSQTIYTLMGMLGINCPERM